MSELKIYVMPLKTNIFGKTIVGQAYYSKSEADKVIAEKDTKIIQLEALIENYNRISREIIDNTNHQKYKRCLAMAKWCRSRACFYDTMRENNLYWGIKSDRAYKWHKRWLKIAEQFKEAK